MQVSSGVSCTFNSVEEFMGQQKLKVEQRKEEMKQIQKGIYQTQVMIESEAMKTLMKECEKNDKKNDGTREDGEKETDEQKTSKNVDLKAEMEKMMSMTKPMI